MDLRSLSSTPLLLDTDSPPAVNRCHDEAIDRLSDIMTEHINTFGAKRDWTAWYDNDRLDGLSVVTLTDMLGVRTQ